MDDLRLHNLVGLKAKGKRDNNEITGVVVFLGMHNGISSAFLLRSETLQVCAVDLDGLQLLR